MHFYDLIWFTFLIDESFGERLPVSPDKHKNYCMIVLTQINLYCQPYYRFTSKHRVVSQNIYLFLALFLFEPLPFIKNNKTLKQMRLADAPSSHIKSTNPTLKFTASPAPLPSQRSSISLNHGEIKTLMKKKQIEYQNEFLIDQAQRVHSILVEFEEKERQERKLGQRNKKKRLKREVFKYNQSAIQEFEKQWDQKFAKTISQLQQVETILSSEHQKQVQKALKDIQAAKNGQNIQKIRFSKQTLELEDQLRRLIKLQRYDEASVANKRLQASKKMEIRRYISQSVDTSRKSLEKIKRRHQRERQMIGQRLSQLYLKQKTHFEQQYTQLVKNMRTYQIDLTKVESKIGRIIRQKQRSKPKCSPSVSDIPAPIVQNTLFITNQAAKQESDQKQGEGLKP